jgi:hypothetical protein
MECQVRDGLFLHRLGVVRAFWCCFYFFLLDDNGLGAMLSSSVFGLGWRLRFGVCGWFGLLAGCDWHFTSRMMVTWLNS